MTLFAVFATLLIVVEMDNWMMGQCLFNCPPSSAIANANLIRQQRFERLHRDIPEWLNPESTQCLNMGAAAKSLTKITNQTANVGPRTAFNI